MLPWRKILVRSRSKLLPLSSTRRGYAAKHPPSPKCKKIATGGKSCGSNLKCDDLNLKQKFEPKTDEFQFHHLIKMPKECCTDPCLDSFISFDQCLYKPSDKAKRKYQVTWVECPPLLIKPKRICCNKPGKPPIARRKRKVVNECVVKDPCATAEGDCPRVKMPGCGPANIPPKCFLARKPSACIKIKAPYPAYSECSRPTPKPMRRIECNCLTASSLCEVIALLKRQHEKGNSNRQCGQ